MLGGRTARLAMFYLNDCASLGLVMAKWTASFQRYANRASWLGAPLLDAVELILADLAAENRLVAGRAHGTVRCGGQRRPSTWPSSRS